jgi:hypothetical protein
MRALESTGVPLTETGTLMKDVWIASAGFVFGWLLSKTWNDPGCQLGLAIFLVVTAAMGLAFALAIVGHRRPPDPVDDDDPDTDDREGPR